MKVIYNGILPVKGFAAINLFGVLFVRKGVAVSERLQNHERIHTRQMVEMLVVLFYLWYVVEWVFRTLGTTGTEGTSGTDEGYYRISFEREAYGHEQDFDYLKGRKLFAWVKYLKK